MISLELGEPGSLNLPKSRALFGRLGNISLEDLVQLMAMNNKTATLAFNRGGEKGKVFFKDGRARHAFAGSLEGEEAMLELLEWTDAEFMVEEGSVFLNKITINKNAEALMLNLCIRLDEIRRARANGTGEVGPVHQSVTRKRRPTRDQPFLTALGKPERKWPLVSTLIAVGLATVSLLFAFGWVSARSEEPIENASVSQSAIGPRIASGPQEAETVAPQLPDLPDSEATTELPRQAAAAGATNKKPTEPVQTPKPTEHGYLLAVVEPWADLWIDGQKQGMTPLGEIDLPAGEHTLTLSNPQFIGVITDQITISSRDTLTKRYSFNDAGYLQLVVFPWAEVYIDGQHLGQTPMGKTKVPVGKHDIMLRHPELGEKHTEAFVQLEETTVVRLDM